MPTKIILDVEYRRHEGEARSEITVQTTRMTRDFRSIVAGENVIIQIKPRIDEGEAEVIALVTAINGADELMIGLGSLIEAAFLTGVAIGKKYE